MRPTLRKSDILRGYSAFSNVIMNGQNAIVPPIRMFWSERPAGQEGVRVGFTTTKHVRSAASRNRLKRLMREAFRLEKGEGRIDNLSSVSIVFMYVGAKEKAAAKVALSDVRPAVSGLLAMAGVRRNNES